jgi:hypothetical protein
MSFPIMQAGFYVMLMGLVFNLACASAAILELKGTHRL